MMVAFNDSFSLVLVGWAPSSRKENGHENDEWSTRTVNYQLSHFLVLTAFLFCWDLPAQCVICIMMTWHWFLSNCHSIVRAVAWASKSNKILMDIACCDKQHSNANISQTDSRWLFISNKSADEMTTHKIGTASQQCDLKCNVIHAWQDNDPHKSLWLHLSLHAHACILVLSWRTDWNVSPENLAVQSHAQANSEHESRTLEIFGLTCVSLN